VLMEAVRALPWQAPSLPTPPPAPSALVIAGRIAAVRSRLAEAAGEGLVL
jgi:hypothetical protein